MKTNIDQIKSRDHSWVQEAVRRIQADHCRTADTHLLEVDIPRFDNVRLYLKDESVHPTGSLKHRLARSLILHGLCSGWIGPNTVLIEASSGSTAVSEAYYARLIGVRSIAVVPRSTSGPKIEAIRAQGGEVAYVDNPLEIYAVAKRLAQETGGHYLDQFTYAERATDWRASNNIAESIFGQMAAEESPVPSWIVCGAGTGGTSATIGRYIRLSRHKTRLCVADPSASVFHRHFGDRSILALDGRCHSVIEGIGRARVEPSFIPDLVDRMIAVPDAQSIGAMRAISGRLGRKVGGSTGTSIVACLKIAEEMARGGQSGSIVTLLCDGGERYGETYYNDDWLASQGLQWREYAEEFTEMLGVSPTPAPSPLGKTVR